MINFSRTLQVLPHWVIPSLTFILLLSGNIWMWKETDNLCYTLISSQNKNIVVEMQVRLEMILYERSKDLAHLASLWQNNQHKHGQSRFMTDAQGIISREKSFYAISRIEKNGTISFRVPIDTETYPLVIKKTTSDSFFTIFKEKNISPLISNPMLNQKQDTLLLLLQPIYSSDTLSGAVVGVLYVREVIRQSIGSTLHNNYRMRFLLGTHVLYDDYTSNENRFSQKSVSILTFKTFGKEWRIESYPLKQGTILSMIEQNNTRFFINIILSFIVSSLLGVTLLFLNQSRRIQSLLRESEQRFRLITDNARDIIFRYLPNAKQYDYISPACEPITGYTQKEFYDNPNLLFAIVEQSSLHGYKEFFNNPNQNVPPFSFKINHRNGESRWLSQKNSLLYNDHGQPIILEGIIADITIQKQTELERENLIKELENNNAELERFIYTISHELKTPLITIKGFLGYIEEEAAMGDLGKLHQDIVRIVSATENMQQLLNDLIELNRIGRSIYENEVIDTNKLVSSVIEGFRNQILKDHIVLNIQPLPKVSGYKKELVELFQNLIENAIKFSRTQDKPQITIGITENNNESVFFIKDNGIGIEHKYKSRIFGLFNKLDPNIEGTGAGLAIVKRIIEHHGGSIYVDSAGPGKGSTFYFKLPLA